MFGRRRRFQWSTRDAAGRFQGFLPGGHLRSCCLMGPGKNIFRTGDYHQAEFYSSMLHRRLRGHGWPWHRRRGPSSRIFVALEGRHHPHVVPPRVWRKHDSKFDRGDDKYSFIGGLGVRRHALRHHVDSWFGGGPAGLHVCWSTSGRHISVTGTSTLLGRGPIFLTIAGFAVKDQSGAVPAGRRHLRRPRPTPFKPRPVGPAWKAGGFVGVPQIIR